MPPPLIQRKIAMVYKLFIVVGVILAFINFRLVKERAQYMYAESTRKVYSSPAVCAAMNDQNDRIVNFTTVQNHSKAKKQVMQVAHCGECVCFLETKPQRLVWKRESDSLQLARCVGVIMFVARGKIVASLASSISS
mmetsp:Transcript_21667/g.32453  ORF Transcript_21667/g.32453 Transcript_21667/m.32453 type:complete len:137 (+) Transcript_21667:224-634(+)